MNFQDYFSTFFENPQSHPLIFQAIIFLLIFALVYVSLTKTKIFKENKAVNGIIALCVSMLAVFYMTKERIFEQTLPYYGMLGLFIILLIPLLILLFFIHRSEIGMIGRKLLLGIYGVIFVYFWYRSYKTTGELWNIAYVVTALVLASGFGLDQQLHELFGKKFKTQ